MSDGLNQIGLSKKETKAQVRGRQSIYADIMSQDKLAKKVKQGGLPCYNWPIKHNTGKKRKAE